MAKITLAIEYELVCPNCYRPLDFIIHDSPKPPQLAVSFCASCVEEMVKAGIEMERKMMMNMLNEYFKNTNKD